MGETWSTMVAVGILFVLPQVVGFIASRVGKRVSAVAWALTPPGTIFLLWGIATAFEHLQGGRRPCSVGLWTGVAALSVMHLGAGAILGVLDQRAARRR